jgi:XXXCH domain-containing protein
MILTETHREYIAVFGWREMKDQDPRENLRLELARHLEALAERLRRGEVAEDLTLAAEVEAGIHIKEKKGRMIAKVSIKWPRAASAAAAPGGPGAPGQLTAFKDIKKQLNARFLELKRLAAGGNFPEAALWQDFLTASQEFSRLAEPEWQTEMQGYLEHVGKLELAWKNRQLEMFQYELQDLQNQMSNCHREHK